MNDSACVPASIYAQAIGKSVRWVSLCFAQANIHGEAMLVRGQKSRGFWSDALPGKLFDELERVRQNKGYRAIADLLREIYPEAKGLPRKQRAFQRWEPVSPMAELHEEDVRRAELLCAALAPVLSDPSIKHASISERARRAQQRCASLLLSPRALHDILRLADERDCGLSEWDRPELYLSEHPRKKPVAPPSSGAEDVHLVKLCGAVIERSAPTIAEANAIWTRACRWLKELTAATGSERQARKTVLGALKASRVHLAGSDESLRKTLANKTKALAENTTGLPQIQDGRKGSAGRPKEFALNDKETAALRFFRLQKGSLNMALRWFRKHPDCCPETRELIDRTLDAAARRKRMPNWPMSLRRAAHVTAEEQAKFRGEKKFQEVELVSHRGLWLPGADGQKVPLRPNTIWESDDMSSNEPFSYLDPECEQILIGRQTLCTQDVFSRAWLSVAPIGRSRDSCRVEDQADHFLEAVLANGMPDMWRVESGLWDNNFINGIPLPDKTRWGGLGALFHIERVRKSKGKGGIESSFNLLQSFLAHESLSIGRKRGEFEKGTKAMMRAKGGDEVAAAKFWSIGEYANAIHDAMKEFNATPKHRRAFGRDVTVPDDLYHGAVRRECPASELWRFCPIKKMATVRRGCVEVSVPYYPRRFCFRVNGEAGNRYFEQGYAVLIAFHPGHPERGCHIFNAERGARNRDNVPFAEFMLLAPFVDDLPQLGLSSTDRELLARKRANAAVTQEFRSIVGSAPRISLVRDSHGQSVRREQGASAPSVVGANSIKAQRAEKRQKQAEQYQQKAKSAEEELHRGLFRVGLS